MDENTGYYSRTSIQPSKFLLSRMMTKKTIRAMKILVDNRVLRVL